MSIKYVNRICPNCKNPNCVGLRGNLFEIFKYKCINCNTYFNDADLKNPPQYARKDKCINSEIDVFKVIRCKDCALRFTILCVLYDQAFPVDKGNYWFCADGRRKDETR